MYCADPFTLTPSHPSIIFSMPKDHVTQCMHYASVFGVRHCLYVVGPVQKIVFVVYFTLTDDVNTSYISDLEQCFWPMVSLVYRDGLVEPYITSLGRKVGFLIERNTFVQRIQLNSSFIRTDKSCNDFLGRLFRLKLRLAMTIHWNFTMENLGFAHRLMLHASLHEHQGFHFSIVVKFFML